LNLQGQITFAGRPSSPEVAAILWQHQIMVVPSVYEESFGVVALEGAAAGCVLLGSDGGGLPEAIGPTGVTFRRGHAPDLAAKLSSLLSQPETWDSFRNAAPAHLDLHQPARVAERYLEVFRRAASPRRASVRTGTGVPAAHSQVSDT
jgi:glycosyltransferase involved in cell wall biosynthesis